MRIKQGRRRFAYLGIVALVALAASLVFATTATGGKQDFRAAILSLGTDKDRSWAQGNYDGGKLAQKRLGVPVTLVFNLVNPDQYLQQAAAFAEKGYNFINLAHGAMVDSAIKAAKQYPNTTFAVDTHPTDAQRAKFPPNLISWDPEQQEGSFQAGVLAALVSKSGIVGGISGVPFPLINRQLEAFELGARCVKSDIKVVTRWTNDWVDVAAANTAAKALMAEGADILFTALNGSVRGVYQAARQKAGTYVIAQYFDQSDQAPDVILTSILYNLQGINADLIKRALNKQFKPRQLLEYNLRNLNVGTLAPFRKLSNVVSPAAKKTLAEVQKKIRSGAIKVPDVLQIGTVGAAKKIDVKSLGC